MNVPIGQASMGPTGELDALLLAISDAIDALVAWNMTAFQSTVERQRAICERLACKPDCRQFRGTLATARKIQDLNRIYDRLLQHSVRWTRTVSHIVQASGDPFPRRPSVDFKG